MGFAFKEWGKQRMGKEITVEVDTNPPPEDSYPDGTIEQCPKCDSQNLTEVGEYTACLDCDWDTLPELPQKSNGGRAIIPNNRTETVEGLPLVEFDIEPFVEIIIRSEVDRDIPVRLYAQTSSGVIYKGDLIPQRGAEYWVQWCSARNPYMRFWYVAE
jgi:hypothetical protein